MVSYGIHARMDTGGHEISIHICLISQGKNNHGCPYFADSPLQLTSLSSPFPQSARLPPLSKMHSGSKSKAQHEPHIYHLYIYPSHQHRPRPLFSPPWPHAPMPLCHTGAWPGPPPRAAPSGFGSPARKPPPARVPRARNPCAPWASRVRRLYGCTK